MNKDFLHPEREARKTAAARQNGEQKRGFSTALAAVYGIFALAATSRSLVQTIRDFSEAPLAYSLSLLAACTYLLAFVLLIKRGAHSQGFIAVCTFELCGVLAVGTLSLLHPEYFPHATVWSLYGIGYGFVPLVLPLVGLLYVLKSGDRVKA
ncbi:hypothetical protein ACUH95_07005 [Dermabacteraceae bacterium P13101]